MKEKKNNIRRCYSISTTDGLEAIVTSTRIAQKGIKLSVFSKADINFIMLETKIDATGDPKQMLENALSNAEKADPFWHQLIPIKKKPLERIFKKEVSAEHQTESIKNSKTLVMTLEIKNDPKLREDYISAHKPANFWPEVLSNMNVMGIIAMELYLTGYRAFLLMEVPEDFDLNENGNRWAALPREKEWQAYVAQFQKVDPKSKATEKWMPLTQVNA